jgi:hypothetical protein
MGLEQGQAFSLSRWGPSGVDREAIRRGQSAKGLIYRLPVSCQF